MSVHAVLFYLTIILLPTQLGFHMWPDWALVLGRRIDYLSPTLFLTDLTLFLTLLTWVVTVKKSKEPLHSLITKKNITILLLVIAIISMNIAFSVAPIISLYKWGKILELVIFGYYIYKTKPIFRYVVIALSIGAAYSSLIGSTQFLLQRTIGGAMWFLGERSFNVITPGIARTNWCWFTTTRCFELLRPYATFPHPNVLGGYLVTTMFLISLALQTEKVKQIRRWFYGVLGISFLTLIFTLSRSAWILCVIAAILYCIFTKRKLNKKTVIGFSIGLGACIIVALPYFLSLNTTQESVFVRYDLASAAIKLFFQYPLFGTGLGTFLVKLPFVLITRDLFFLQPVHNIFLLWIVETGSIGIIFLCLAIKKYSAYLIFSKTPVVQYVPLILLLLVGLVDHYPLSVQQGQLLLTVLVALPFINYNHS